MQGVLAPGDGALGADRASSRCGLWCLTCAPANGCHEWPMTRFLGQTLERKIGRVLLDVGGGNTQAFEATGDAGLITWKSVPNDGARPTRFSGAQFDLPAQGAPATAAIGSGTLHLEGLPSLTCTFLFVDDDVECLIRLDT